VLRQLVHPFRGMERLDRLAWRGVSQPWRSLRALVGRVGGLVREVAAVTTRKTPTAT
jgi:hypothetical protein